MQNPPNVTSRVKSIAVFTPHLPFLVSNEKTLVSHIQQTVKVRAQDSKTISYNTYFYQDMITPGIGSRVYPNKSIPTSRCELHPEQLMWENMAIAPIFIKKKTNRLFSSRTVVFVYYSDLDKVQVVHGS